MIAGGATALTGALTETDSLTFAGVVAGGLGLATIYDGGNAIATAVDGKERAPALQEFGGAILGADGANAGRELATILSISNAARGMRSVRALTATDKEAVEAIKGVDKVASDPCGCE